MVEILPPNDPPVDPPAPAPAAPATRTIVCEFCECRLTPAGEVMRMGDRARRVLKDEQTIEDLKADNARLAAELQTATNDLRELRAASARETGRARIPIFD